MALVENILSLENEADSIVAQARAAAKEIERSADAEVEAYRRQLAEETEQKSSAFRKETEGKHHLFIAEARKELDQTLDAMDEIADGVLREKINQIVTRFSEF
jgi:vacuolar-type H+-ATPase subunit H